MLQLARTALLIRPKLPATSLFQRRPSSSDNHDHGQHESHEYPKEGFTSPAWRNGVLFSLFVVGFYKFAPTPNDDVYLTRWIHKFTTPREVWEKLNIQHLVLTQEASEEHLLVGDAQRPKTHVFRYPQSFDQFSPHKQAVGEGVDMSSVKVNGDLK